MVVDEGESFIIETQDTYNGRVKSEEDVPIPRMLDRIGYVNPVGGPVYINGAKRGDVLAVTIHNIVPGAHGVTLLIPGQGPLRDSARWQRCQEPRTYIIQHSKTSNGSSWEGKAHLNSYDWNLRPMIGTIGVAPENPIFAGCDTLTGQGPWGGNLDCRDMCSGTKVYFPVCVDGGMLFAGDVHGSQGDGELTGEADETTSETTLSCEIMKRKAIPFVRFEKEDSIVQLNCDKPLEKAVTQSFLWMLDWLVEDYDFKAQDAYVLMSIHPRVRINIYQMVDVGRLRYTVGFEFPKSLIGKSDPT
jgi:amidase